MIRVGIPVALILLISAPQSAQARGRFAYLCYDYVYDLLGNRDKYCEKPRWARATGMDSVRKEVISSCTRMCGRKTKAHVKYSRRPFHRLMKIYGSECNKKVSLSQVIKRKYLEGHVRVPCGRKRILVTVREYRRGKKVVARKWIAPNGSSITQSYSEIKKEKKGKRKLTKSMAKFFCGSAGKKIYGALKRWFRNFHTKRYKALLKMCRAKKYKPRECYEIKTRTSGNGVRD